MVSVRGGCLVGDQGLAVWGLGVQRNPGRSVMSLRAATSTPAGCLSRHLYPRSPASPDGVATTKKVIRGQS